MEPGPFPEGVTTTVTSVKTADGAVAPGILYEVAGATTVAALMHPRQDLARHYLIPILLGAGYAVWAQSSRSPNNDLTLIHEEAVLDAAAGFRFLRDRGFERVVAVGPSGGATLYALYAQQSSLEPSRRIGATPGGKATGLGEAELPALDAVAFVAPHPGQGELLLGCIDGSVASEEDPLSTVPELDPFDPRNGFAEPPASSSYDEAFLERYRAAQRDRVARIDERARELIGARLAAKARFKETGELADQRASVMNEVLRVYRTDADPRTVDLSLEPNDRPYGSIHGTRPNVINYGITGFGRLTTADAWLSTWSGLSSNASFVACAPDIRIPSLFVEYTADQATSPARAAEMFAALGSADKTRLAVVGTHFGGSPSPEGPPGGALAGAQLIEWLRARFPAA
jgi:hypothetical protein